MPASALPDNEADRLRAVRRLGLADATADPALTHIIALAARLLNAPIAMITIVDDQVRVCGAIGFPDGVESRERSFCSHAILSVGPMVIEDALLDERTGDNPLVTGPQGLRFYAGIPLLTLDGFAVGTLCVLDTQPRALLPEDLEQLVHLAGLAEAVIRQHELVAYGRDIERQRDASEATLVATNSTLAARDKMLTLVIDSVPAAIAYWDADLRCIFANRSMCERFGTDPSNVLGMSAREMIGDELFALRGSLLYRGLGGEILNYQAGFAKPDGSPRWANTTIIPDRQGGSVRGIFVLSTDHTDRKQLAAELDHARDHAVNLSAGLSRLLELTGSIFGESFFERTALAMSELLRADLIFISRVDDGAHGMVGYGPAAAEIAWNLNVGNRPSQLLFSDPRADRPGVLRRDGAVMIVRDASELCAGKGALQLQAFLGVPVVNDEGRTVALVNAAFADPIEDAPRQELMFKTGQYLAARIGAELERLTLETARKAAAAALLDEKERLRVTLHAIGDGVIVTGPDERVTMMNGTAEKLTGWRLADALGTSIKRVLKLTHPQPSKPPGLPGRLPSETNAVAAGDTTLIDKDGTEVVIDASEAPIIGQDGGVIGSITVLHDVTEARLLLKRVRQLAHYDALTGLPNRTLFHDRLTQAVALAKRTNKRCGVLFLDIDHFKSVNDTLGHTVGDKLLGEVARTISSVIRESDTVARMGGDEFVVITGGLNSGADAALVAHKILNSVAQITNVAGHEVDVSFSIGIAIFPDDASDAEALLTRADAAMYQAKGSGRNASVFFNSEVDRTTQLRNQMRSRLAKALQSDEFALLYQPKVDLKAGDVVGAEALIRWYPSLGETVSPVQFIPVAEEAGLILPIGDWVVSEACRQVRAWTDQGLPLIPVSVNVSMLSLREPGFVATLRRALETAGIPPRALEIESRKASR